MSDIAYILATKQEASLRHLDVVTNNMANSNTTGFKQDGSIFEQYLVDDVNEKTSFGIMRATVSDMKEGTVKMTARSLDVAVSGAGFFMVRTPLGNRYTRNGNFHISPEGKLVTSEGYPVLTADGQELVFEESDNNPLIGEDGSIFVGSANRGTIGVVEFDNHKMLRKFGNGLFSSDSNPKEATKSRVLQGVLEESNVNSVQQIAKLVEINREVALSTQMINEFYSSQRNTFKALSQFGGGN